MRVAVVGGGVAGLAAAWELRDRADVTVYEPGPLGGKVQTTELLGQPADRGADAFLSRVPEAVALCEELGLGAELVAPAAGGTLLWRAGRLHALPDGLVLGVPRRLGPLVRSRLLSPLGMARAGLDLVLPRRELPADVAVWDLVAGRFGAEVATRLVDPLLGSIHATRTEELSAAATAPQLLGAARRSRSLLLGLRAAGTPATGQPIFLTPRGGVGVLVTRLVDRLRGAGVRFVPLPVDALAAGLGPAGGVGDGRGAVVAVGGGEERFDAVVVAVAAPVAARLLGDAAPGGLRRIGSTSVTLVTMAYTAGELPVPAAVNGILASRDDGRLMTACSFASNKWPHRATPGHVVVRVSTGWSGDDRADRIADEPLVARLSGELGAALGGRADPVAWQVNRWPGAFPRYLPGHLERVTAIEAELAGRAPGVALAGSSYRGAGIPACIGGGRRAAAALVERVGGR